MSADREDGFPIFFSSFSISPTMPCYMVALRVTGFATPVAYAAQGPTLILHQEAIGNSMKGERNNNRTQTSLS
jgi:hypothetical protein